MAQIEVIRDPNIDHADIAMALLQDTTENMSGTWSPSNMIQTKVYGIFTPILAFNGVVIDPQDILSFELKDVNETPSIKFKFWDRKNIFKRYLDTGAENTMQVQIIPADDDMYKKINLDFLVTEFSLNYGLIEGRGEYKLIDLYKSQWKSFGEISTFELFDKVSTDTKLGFASNVRETQDKRFINCSYKSYLNLLGDEIRNSDSNEVHVYDWWVDLWNNLILCDLYDRIHSVDTEEEMGVWVQFNKENALAGQDAEYIQLPAILSNLPTMATSDLHIRSVEVLTKPVGQQTGTALTVTCWMDDQKEYISHVIKDGDIDPEQESMQFEYLGEVYGEYNYLLARRCRDLYLDKVLSESIVVDIDNPHLGLTRGSQVRVVIYDNDSQGAMLDQNMPGMDITREEILATSGWLQDFELKDRSESLDPMKLNLIYSGQYTIMGQIITFDGPSMSWNCRIKLVRPRDQKPEILPKTNNDNG